MDWFENIKSIFELLYFVAGIALLVGIYLTFKQLKLMREDMVNNYKRNAVEKSIEYLNWFATSLLPLLNKSYEAIQGKKVIVYDNLKEYSFEFNDEVKLNKEVLESVRVKVSADFEDVSNQLEYFSAAMVSGLADEKLAFSPLAKMYCNYVEISYDLYCQSRSAKQGKTLYKNTIELYNMWSVRLRELELNESKMKLDKEIASLNPKSINPIGLE